MMWLVVESGTASLIAFIKAHEVWAVPVYTENLIRVDDVMGSPKLAE